MNHNKVLSLLMMMMMMMMMMDDDALMVVDVACLLSHGVGEQGSLFCPQNGFGNPKRRVMRDSVQSVFLF